MLDLHILKTSELERFRGERSHEAVIVMPAVKMAQAKALAGVLIARAKHPGLLVIAEDDSKLGFIATANAVYARTDSRFFAYIAQDAFPGKHWLDFAVRIMQSTGAGLLAFNDGKWFGGVASFGMAERSFTNSLYGNLLFYPQYMSHCADVELSTLARNADKLAYHADCIMLEVDYTRHLRPPQNTPDDTLFHRRRQAGFPLLV